MDAAQSEVPVGPVTAVDAKLGLVAALLQAEYGSGPWRCHGDPLSELVGTVLSQHTSDINTERAFRSLQRALPTWEEVENAPVEVVAEAIRCGGLANTKAPRIQAILGAVREDRAGFNLDNLEQMSVGDARAWLTRLPGVGPKTASCVLLFSLGKPAFPVDTHVHRVSRRLGLVPDTASPEQVQDLVESLVGDDTEALYALHIDMIRHGRQVCLARSPRCEVCILSSRCDDFHRRQESADRGTASTPEASEEPHDPSAARSPRAHRGKPASDSAGLD